MTAEEIIGLLALVPHPEGGAYRETWRDEGAARGAGTAIYYLLRANEISHWHRVDATEIWHFYAGAPLHLSFSADGEEIRQHVLGPHLAEGQRPQLIVPAQAWQSAETAGEWTLVGCTVSPAFQFAGFEMAPAGWAPGGR